MAQALNKLTLKGFKSIESLLDFELRPLNVLIGANGAGKSNFVDFFRMLRAMAEGSLGRFVTERGGADQFFYLGPRQTRQIWARLEIGLNAYEFELSATATGLMMVGSENTSYKAKLEEHTYCGPNAGHNESILTAFKTEMLGGPGIPQSVNRVAEALAKLIVYHFHDTSQWAPMRREQSVRDYDVLRDDASYIAAYLLYLREKFKSSYDLIRDTVRMIAPFFDDFTLRPETKGPEEKVRLEWRQKGSDYPFQPYQLSDGTIRFICLATALIQPRPPATIVIDEPELGLHPFAINLLANLIQSAAERTQVIVSTQSPDLLNWFKPEDVIVVNRQAGHSIFDRLGEDNLREWLAEYSLAELWQKNVLRGGPDNE
jgi:predicted ATPase